MAGVGGRGLVHPLPLASVALLLLNDHVLKRVCPSWLTGKLSDFAGLFFFPLLLVAVAELSARMRGRRRLVASIACIATAGVFAAIKLSPACNAVANHVGTFVFDPTDVVALASVAAAWFFAVDRPRPSPGVARWQTGVAIVVASGASVATVPAQELPKYPMWTMWTVLDGGPTVLGCAEVEAWIPKSGSEGFGLTVALDTPAGCNPTVRATFHAGDVSITSTTVTPGGDEHRFAYLPFIFDNAALFDRHVENGEIVITVDDGKPHQRMVKLQQRRVPALVDRGSVNSAFSMRGPTSMMTSCGPVHARAEAEGPFGLHGLRFWQRRIVFTVAPGCDVDATAVSWLQRRAPGTTDLDDLGRSEATIVKKSGSTGSVAGDFWINLPMNAFGRFEVELRDGDRRLPWAIEVDAPRGYGP